MASNNKHPVGRSLSGFRLAVGRQFFDLRRVVIPYLCIRTKSYLCIRTKSLFVHPHQKKEIYVVEFCRF